MQITENGGIPADICASYYNGASFSSNSALASTNAAIVAVTHAASATPVLYLNNVVGANANDASLNGNTIFRIGADGTDGADRFFDGAIAEIIIYSRVLTVAEVILINRYLSRKYGIGISI